MARLPEPAPLLLASGGDQYPSPFRERDRGKAARLLFRRGLGTVEFEEQGGRLRQRQSRIGVAGAQLHLVEQLDAGERQAHL
jgi:hypothetical protein